MPAFWDTPVPPITPQTPTPQPRCPMITHASDSHQIPSQNQTVKDTNLKRIANKLNFCNFVRNFTRNIPFEVAW